MQLDSSVYCSILVQTISSECDCVNVSWSLARRAVHPVTLEDTVNSWKAESGFLPNEYFLSEFHSFWRTASTKRASAVGGISECFYPHVATLQKRNVQLWNQKRLKLSETKGKWPVLLSESCFIVDPRCRMAAKLKVLLPNRVLAQRKT